MGQNHKYLLLFLLCCFVGIEGIQLQFRFLNNYLYQTTLKTGGKNLTVLLDLTGTELWLFKGKNSSDTTILQGDDTPSANSTLTTLFYSSKNGLYDANFNVSALPSTLDGGILLGGNVSLNGTIKYGAVFASNYSELRKKDPILGAGILGWGKTGSSNLTDYLGKLFNVTVGRFVLCTRPPYAQAVLVINEDYFNASIVANATTTPINSVNQIKPGAFEFNVTSVKIGSGYYVETAIPTTVSTLSNFVTVDPRTWQYIQYKFKPIFDPKKSNYLVNCWLMRKLRLEFNVQQPKNSTTKARSLMIPGTELVSQTKSGYCQLRIRPSTLSQWVLGGPFLRHHCVQFDLAKQQITFVNNSIFYPWKKHVYG